MVVKIKSIKSKMLFFLLIILLVVRGGVAEVSAGVAYQPRLIMLIDLNDLMCFNCLMAFSRFCQSLPPSFLQEKTLGILMVKEKNLDYHRLQIIKKKLRGFRQSHQIEFPIWIDLHGLFNSFSSRGTSLVLMGKSMADCRCYSFPLLPHQESEILEEIFLERE